MMLSVWIERPVQRQMLLAIFVFATGASLGLIGALLGDNFIFAGASFIALGSAQSEHAKEPEEPDEQVV